MQETSWVISMSPPYKSSPRRCSVKKGVLKNFANFIGKHVSWGLFSINLQACNTPLHGIMVVKKQCMKRVRIRSLSGPYFPAIGLNTDTLRIQFECDKIRNRKTPNTDTFYAVKSSKYSKFLILVRVAYVIEIWQKLI